MRLHSFFALPGLIVLSLLLLVGFRAPAPTEMAGATPELQPNALEGAWRLKSKTDGVTTIQLVQDGYFTVAVFDEQNRKFIGTYGGTFRIDNGELTQTTEFNTFDSLGVSTTMSGKVTLKNGTWHSIGTGNKPETWERIKEPKAAFPLAGTWRITARERDGEMQMMRPGPRKTLKVLTGTRFQWIAFNTETGEFSGTGGGTYTAKDGKYTEHIEFFSRDPSRVGMQLSFNYEVKDGNWHHTGQSSTGNKVNEVWVRIIGK